MPGRRYARRSSIRPLLHRWAALERFARLVMPGFEAVPAMAA